MQFGLSTLKIFVVPIVHPSRRICIAFDLAIGAFLFPPFVGRIRTVGIICTVQFPLLSRSLPLVGGQPVEAAMTAETDVAIVIDAVAPTVVAVPPALGQTLCPSNRFGLEDF